MTPIAVATTLISIIIPSLNEAANLPIILEALGNHLHVETIVVDGGSSDNSVEISNSFGAIVLGSQRGRAKQMNRGAEHARGDVLLFLHADTLLPETWPDNVQEALRDTNVCGGAFSLGIQGDALKLRLIEKLADFRSRWFSLPYGDQAIFVRSSAFKEMGGFPDLPIMEDFEFMRRLRQKGTIRILPERVLTSSRRWQQLGVLRTTAINQMMIFGYYLGMSPDKLEGFYRRKR